MSSERGFTIVELMVAIASGMVVVLAIFGLVEVTTQDRARIAARVEADQLARPALQRIVDELHSTCVGPGVTPILAGSTDNAISFLSQTGSAVSPTPDKHVIALSGDKLTDSIYHATGGTAPNWSFAATPTSTQTLATGVGQARLSGSSSPPIFQYFAYQGAQLSSTPLPTPLIATDASRATSVAVAFSVAPGANPTADPTAGVSLSDSVVLRLSPASEDAGEVNPPCA